MTTTRRKQLIVGGVVLVVIIFIVYGFLPDPVMVQTDTVQHDRLEVTVEEEGVTRVVDQYTMSATSTAWMRRIMLEPGDTVRQGQVLVELEPPRSGPLDPRSREQAEARSEAAAASLVRAERGLDAAAAARRQAETELHRVKELLELGSATAQMLERAETEAVTARAREASAQAALTAARAELRATEAMLGEDNEDILETTATLRAPAEGRVLRVHRESEGMVTPGVPLMDIGNTEALEVRSDVLSQDAVLIEPGSRVLLDQWGGDRVLEGVVQRVEPQGYTAVSSLGVEEQRVNVIATIVSGLAERERLGSGYRVLARFIVWENDDVLQVPSSALFRTEDGWAAFVVQNGHAERRTVEIGQRTGLWAQVLGGLTDGETVIVHPGNDVEEGVSVQVREP